MLDINFNIGYNIVMLNNNIGNKMNTLYTQNQSKDKITQVSGAWRGSLTCYYNDKTKEGVNIPLTALEEMWYGHEECVNHPEGSEFPVDINKPFMKLMRERVVDSVLHRTGININDFDGVIHASSLGPSHF